MYLTIRAYAFFVLTIMFALSSSTAYANHNYQVGDGNDCRAPLSLGENGNAHCAPGLECRTSNDSGSPDQTVFIGACVQPDPPLSCTCITPNSAVIGQNGFRCGTDANAPIVYCGSADLACVNSQGTPVGSDVSTPDGQTPYARNTLSGVRCTRSERIAQCTCANPGQAGSGKNGVNCVVDGTGEQASTYCSDADIACNPAQGQAISTVLLKDSILPDTILQGVTCSRLVTATQAAERERRIYPTTPPPPPPPCNEALSEEGCGNFSTAIGLLGTKPEEFIASLFAFLLSISGGIAILLIMRAGYQMMTSQGQPEKINNARDHLVAAIVGLIFLIFSFVVLQIIGFDILRIPGFAG